MNYEILTNEFKKIKEKGWIQSINSNSSGVGETFEKLINLQKNKFPYADYFGIEIKTQIKNSNYAVGLFSCTPKGKHEKEINYIREKYGYLDKKNQTSKILNTNVYGNKITNVGINYKASLFVNQSTKTIQLLMYQKNKRFIEGTTYWTFRSLQEKLEDKCPIIALITADKQFYRGKEYFKYQKISLYKLKDFKTFLKLIEDGTIFVNFKIGIYRKGIFAGQMHDHGTGFALFAKDFEKLFDKFYEFGP